MHGEGMPATRADIRGEKKVQLKTNELLWDNVNHKVRILFRIKWTFFVN